MSNSLKIIETISISKDEILEKYSQMNQYFIDCIRALYGECVQGVDIKCFLPCNIINKNGENFLSILDCLKGKAGVYIFMNNDSVPVYIGKGGTSSSINKKAKDLKFRIGQELGSGNKHNTLSNNIITIDSMLSNNTITESESIEHIKCFSLIVISSGDRINDGSLVQDSIDRANNLETILISLFHPKYNK